MFRLVWATDVHLEFADVYEKQRFAAQIVKQRPTALMLTGDIANAKQIEPLLKELHKEIQVPIYFNLGNHDFYGGSIDAVRKWATEITRDVTSDLRWIEAVGIVKLSNDTCLIGIDGWGDGHIGDPYRSRVVLNDWDHIYEFHKIGAIINYGHRIKLLNKLGKEAAEKLKPVLAEALTKYNRVLLMTHVPPWLEATWHQGKHSDEQWAPWFSCKAVGDAIVKEAKKHPGKKVTVFCGHTHGFGYSEITDQVDVYTGGAIYQFPEVQCCLEIGDGIFTRESGAWYNAKEP